MKLTYTIEVDVIREDGQNLSRADVSGVVINRLIEAGGQWKDEAGTVQPGTLEIGDIATYAVRDWTVFAHEGSEPAPPDA